MLSGYVNGSIINPVTPRLTTYPNNTGLAFRLPPEIAGGRRRFPAANKMRDLYCFIQQAPAVRNPTFSF